MVLVITAAVDEETCVWPKPINPLPKSSKGMPTTRFQRMVFQDGLTHFPEFCQIQSDVYQK